MSSFKTMKNKKGKVYIIGAGLGPWDLMTIRAMNCLKQADVILHDRLISSEHLHFVSPKAKLIYVGKKASFHTLPQDEIEDLIVEQAKKGKIVARLKGGDPYVFGRGGEEAERLVKEGIPFEVIPGISSAIAGALFAGIPLTHRKYTPSIAIVTGHEAKKDASDIPYEHGKERPASLWIDWSALAKMGTIVFLMGVGNVRANMKKLIEFGKNQETSVAAIRWAGTGKQKTLIGKIKNIADLIKEKNFKAPAVIVVGEVVELSPQLNFFEKLSLHNKTVLITRDSDSNLKLQNLLQQQGAQVISLPSFTYKKLSLNAAQKKILQKINQFDWLVFTSVRSVEFFVNTFFKTHKDLRILMQVKIAAVGKKTAQSLYAHSLWTDYVSQNTGASGLAKSSVFQRKKNLKILLPQSQDAKQDFINELSHKHKIQSLVLYKKSFLKHDSDSLQKIMDTQIDWVLFFSPSAVQSFFKNFGESHAKDILNRSLVGVIGKTTEGFLKEKGVTVKVVSTKNTSEDLIQKII